MSVILASGFTDLKNVSLLTMTNVHTKNSQKTKTKKIIHKNKSLLILRNSTKLPFWEIAGTGGYISSE